MQEGDKPKAGAGGGVLRGQDWEMVVWVMWQQRAGSEREDGDDMGVGEGNS